jgi:hypothetical protein
MLLILVFRLPPHESSTYSLYALSIHHGILVPQLSFEID